MKADEAAGPREAAGPPNPGGGALPALEPPPPKPGGGAFAEGAAAADGFVPSVGLGEGTARVVNDGAAVAAVTDRKLALIGLELGPSEGKSSLDCAAAAATGVGFELSRLEDEDEGLLDGGGLDLLWPKANPGIAAEASPFAAADFGG